MKEYILQSEFEFLIKIKNEEKILNKFNSFSIKIEDDENCIIKFYPLFYAPKSLPFCVELNKIENFENVKILNIEENAIIKIFPYALSCFEDILKVSTFSYASNTISVITSKNNIFVLDDNKKITISNPLSEDFEYKHEGAFLIGKSNSKIVIICLKDLTYKIYDYDKLNINNNNFELLKDANDFSGHLKFLCLNFENEKIKEQNELFYKENKPQKTTNSKLIPSIVLDCVKIGDLELAKSYISNSIILNGNTLKDFFEDFDSYEIFNNSYYLIKQNKAYKKLNFFISNNQIVDIEDKQLY